MNKTNNSLYVILESPNESNLREIRHPKYVKKQIKIL